MWGIINQLRKFQDILTIGKNNRDRTIKFQQRLVDEENIALSDALIITYLKQEIKRTCR